MDDDPNDAECSNESCVNIKNNLKMLMRTTQRQAADLKAFSQISAEADILRVKLVETEKNAQIATETAIEAVNQKEIAQAELKQIESASEFHKKKVLQLQAEVDETDNHKQQANMWREKYDSICSLAEKLESNNIDVKAKYESAVQMAKTLAKQLKPLQNQAVKVVQVENKQNQKILNKYLKGAIQVIDALSNTANLSKQPKNIKDLVNAFRRDDVRLHFNSDPWKNSSERQVDEDPEDPEDTGELDDHADYPDDPAFEPQDNLLQGGRSLSDDEVDEDEDDPAIQQMEKELTEAVVKSTRTRELTRPDFGSKMRELNARKKAPRIVESKKVKNWPQPIQKPAATRSGGFQARHGLIDPRKIHAVHAPVTDFDAISKVSERRKEALLAAGTSEDAAGTSGATASASGSGTSIHGRKGKTVRELQSEMMKGESVKEKVARMKAAQNAQDGPSTSVASTPAPAASDVSEVRTAKLIPTVPIPLPTKRNVPRVTHTQSFRMSEPSDSEDDVQLDEVDPRIAKNKTGRRSTSVLPRSRSISRSSKSSEAPRRSGRLAHTPVKPEPPMVLRRTTRNSSRAASRKNSPTRSITPVPPATQNLISQAVARKQRARLRSIMRGEDDFSMDSEPPQSQETSPKKPRNRGLSESSLESESPVAGPSQRQSLKDRAADDVLKRRLQPSTSIVARKRAAPAPLDAGPPLRVKGGLGIAAPKKKEVKEPEVRQDEPVDDLEASQEIQQTQPIQQLQDSQEFEEPEPQPSIAPRRVAHLIKSAAPTLVSTISPDFSVLMNRENSTSTPIPQQAATVDLNQTAATVQTVQIVKSPEAPAAPAPKPEVSVASTASTASTASSVNELRMDLSMDEEEEVAPQPTPMVQEEKAPEDVPVPAAEVPKPPEVVAEVPKHVDVAPEVAIEAPKPPEPPAAVPVPPTTPSRLQTVSDLSAPPPPSIRRPVTPKSPKQIIECKYGLDISDSEEEEELQLHSAAPKTSEPPKSTIAEPKKLTEVQKKSEAAVKAPEVVTDGIGVMSDDSYDSKDPRLEIEDSDGAPSTSQVVAQPVKPVKLEPALKSTMDDNPKATASSNPVKGEVPEVPKPVIPVKTEAPKTPAPKPAVPKIIIPPDQKNRPLKPRQAPAPKPNIPAPVRIPSSQTTDEDLSFDILAGAKMSKPVVKKQKRPAPSASSTSDAPVEPATKRVAPDDAPSTSDAPKLVVPTTTKPPAKTRAASVAVPRVKKASTQLAKARSTSVKLKLKRPEPKDPKESEKPEEVEDAEDVPDDDIPTTSAAAGKKGGAILIEARRRGRQRKADTETKPIGVKEMGAKRSAKALNTARAQLRQALDLKLPITELQRPLEEKGIVLVDGSIPLAPSDAVDVMMEFLRESSASDMWAVVKKQRSDGNLAQPNNKEEENFLQVSVSLNSDHELLLELFIGRILTELCRRDTLDSKQCGRYTRLFCHAIFFAKKPEEQNTEWIRRFVLLLLNKHEHQLIKAVAYCLISDVAEHCRWLVEEIDEPSAFAMSFKVLMHLDSEQAAVLNWLLNAKFQYAYIPQQTEEDIKKAFAEAHKTFLDADDVTLEVRNSSMYLAKTGAPVVLTVAFRKLKEQMTMLEKQFLEPQDKEKEMKHKTVYSLPTVSTKLTLDEASTLKRELEWQKLVLMIMIDNPMSNNWKAIIEALKEISPQIVALRELLLSPESEQFAEPPAIDPVRHAVDELCQLISEFTNFPLKPTVLPVDTSVE